MAHRWLSDDELLCWRALASEVIQVQGVDHLVLEFRFFSLSLFYFEGHRCCALLSRVYCSSFATTLTFIPQSEQKIGSTNACVTRPDEDATAVE